MELSYRRAQLLELSRILAQCFENVNHYEDFARVDRSEALSAVRLFADVLADEMTGM